jgi:hypothetical protein
MGRPSGAQPGSRAAGRRTFAQIARRGGILRGAAPPAAVVIRRKDSGISEKNLGPGQGVGRVGREIAFSGAILTIGFIQVAAIWPNTHL